MAQLPFMFSPLVVHFSLFTDQKSSLIAVFSLPSFQSFDTSISLTFNLSRSLASHLWKSFNKRRKSPRRHPNRISRHFNPANF
jgi:hypothetical protein